MGMKILLINVDSRWNMAIRRMYNFFREENEVEMIDLGFSGYPHKKPRSSMELDLTVCMSPTSSISTKTV